MPCPPTTISSGNIALFHTATTSCGRQPQGRKAAAPLVRATSTISDVDVWPVATAIAPLPRPHHISVSIAVPTSPETVRTRAMTAMAIPTPTAVESCSTVTVGFSHGRATSSPSASTIRLARIHQPPAQTR